MSWRKRLRQKWQYYHWLIFGMVALVALGFGYVGFAKHYAALGETRSSLDIFYRTLQLIAWESGFVPVSKPWELELARLLVPFVAAYAALKTLTVIFREQFQLLRVRFVRNHIIICGLGRKGVLLAQKFRKQGYRVVVIELDEGNDLLEQCREYGAIVLIGSAASREMLRKARIHKAKYIISVCGDEGINAEIAVNARELVGDQEGKILTCVSHIVDPQLCKLLREQEIETRKIGAFRLEFFNIFDSGARSWLKDYSPFNDAGGIPISQPHILIVGVGRMGESLIVHAAKKWNDLTSTSGKKLRITIIDKKAKVIKKLLYLRYPPLKKVCKLSSLQRDIESSDFQSAGFLFDREKRCDVTSIFICLDNDSFGLSTALILHQRIKKYKIPVMVRMTRDIGLSSLMHREGIKDDTYMTLYAFGLLDRTCQPEQVLVGTNEIIARSIHKNYRRCHPSMVSWDELPEDLKESNRQQADHIGEKLKETCCGIVPLTDWDEKLFEFTPEEIELMAKMEHKRWMSERQRIRWKLGPKKIKKKRTPYLVPWDELSEEMKEEDRDPVRNLPFYLAKAGFNIIRLEEKDEE